MIQNIDDILEQWSRWRVDRQKPSSGYGTSMLSRAMDSMPSAKCVPCNGNGRVSASKYGLKTGSGWINCLNCNGTGKIKLDTTDERTQRCTSCKGKGDKPANRFEAEKPEDEQERTPCTACAGSGRIKTRKINPAFIRPPGKSGPRTDFDDPQSQRVDWLVCTAITEYERSILITEYCLPEKQVGKNQSERSINLKVSQGYYSKLLASAKDKIEQGMNEWRESKNQL